MNCDDARDRLLEGTEDVADDVRQHLEGCPDCQATLATASLVREHGPTRAPVGSALRLLERLEREGLLASRVVELPPPRRRPVALWAAAAALILGLATLTFLSLSSGRTPAEVAGEAWLALFGPGPTGPAALPAFTEPLEVDLAVEVARDSRELVVRVRSAEPVKDVQVLILVPPGARLESEGRAYGEGEVLPVSVDLEAEREVELRFPCQASTSTEGAVQVQKGDRGVRRGFRLEG